MTTTTLKDHVRTQIAVVQVSKVIKLLVWNYAVFSKLLFEVEA